MNNTFRELKREDISNGQGFVIDISRVQNNITNTVIHMDIQVHEHS